MGPWCRVTATPSPSSTSTLPMSPHGRSTPDAGSLASLYCFLPWGRDDCKHNHLRPLPVQPSPEHLVAEAQDGVLLPTWYTQPNHEGTAGPLASVLAKSRLSGVVQEFRN